MKLYAIPMIIVIIALLYMFVGILQQKAHLLFAFIALQVMIKDYVQWSYNKTFFQISVTFGIAVLIVIILISVACNTTFILKFFVDISLAQSEYSRFPTTKQCENTTILKQKQRWQRLLDYHFNLEFIYGLFEQFVDAIAILQIFTNLKYDKRKLTMSNHLFSVYVTIITRVIFRTFLYI